MSSSQLVIAAAVNNELVLTANLVCSPCLRGGLATLHCQRHRVSAADACNHAIETLPAQVIAFVHQDVYLPSGWVASVKQAMRILSQHDPTWAVAGVVGVDAHGAVLGRSWSNGLNREIRGRTNGTPMPAVSVDEIVILLRTCHGLRFDEDLPGFHLYGTDITQQAIARGLGAYVIDAPVIHNSLPIGKLDAHFQAGYRHMQQKWRSRLPLRTCIVPITRTQFPLWRHEWRTIRKQLSGPRVRQVRHDRPLHLAQVHQYERHHDACRAA